MSALVLYSGGQDSTTCLYWAMREFPGAVEAVGFDYGQRHASELDAAEAIAERAGVPFEQLRLPPIGSPSAADGPVVPARNLILLSMAAAIAIPRGHDVVVIGACATDAQLFPDCRREFLEAADNAFLHGGYGVRVVAPLVDLDKLGVLRLARDLGVLDVVLNDTVSCYRAARVGDACGKCGACVERQAARDLLG